MAEYSKLGLNAIAKLAGNVQGVVVQIITKTSLPLRAGSMDDGSLFRGNLT